jgi:hypothetical protein
VLLVLLLEALNACGGVFVMGGASGCVEACYGGRDVEDECWGVYICVGLHYVMLRWMCGMCVGFSTKQVSLVWRCR